MKPKIADNYDRLLIMRFGEESDEIDEVVGVTIEEVYLLVQHLQNKMPDRSVLDYLKANYGE